MKIYSYYSDIPELSRVDELKLVSLWLNRWRAAGWDPFVLNEYHARKHAYFAEFDQAVTQFPSVNPGAYDYACWIRHLALAQVGGGFMSDFDCIPYENAKATAGRMRGMDKTRLNMFQSCAPSFFHATPEVGNAVCREFTKGVGMQEVNGKPHMSDMYSLVAMPVELVQPHDLVKGFGDEGWDVAGFVHFSSGSMGPAGKLPKWRFIPKLRAA